MQRPIIFDFDGTVVDSEPLANRGLAEVLTELGFPTTYEQALTTYIGLRMIDCVKKIEHVHGRTPPESFPELCRARITALVDKHLQPVPGVVPFIRARAHTQNIAIASSSRVVSIERGLHRVGLTGTFDGRIFSAADLERGKPHPDVYLIAADALAARGQRPGRPQCRRRGHDRDWNHRGRTLRPRARPYPRRRGRAYDCELVR
jgi:beta-phosphoglucomutase-like phosphatase (HAD superfamily)